jgi:CRP/FNR family transcriptional regulator, cyclic AMP receptor protein
MPTPSVSNRAVEPGEKLLLEGTLRRTRTLAEWSDESIRRLAQAASLKTYAPGELVAASGDPPTGVWLVRTGLLETSRVWRDGQRLIADFLEPGRMTGHLAVIDDLALVYHITARRPSSVVFIPAAEFRACLAADPRAPLAMLGMLCRLIRHEYDRGEMQAFNSMRARIAKALLYLGRSALAEEGELEVRVSQDDIAAWLAVTRQTINVELVWFVEAGILARRYGRLIVQDLGRLQDVAWREEPISAASLKSYELAPYGQMAASD